MEDKIKVLLTEEEVDEKIKVLGKKSLRIMPENPYILCAFLRAAFFMCELANGSRAGIYGFYVRIKLRKRAPTKLGAVRIVKDLDEPLEGKNVLIVEDIIDSGNTLHYLVEILFIREIRKALKSVRCWISRDRRAADVNVDYVGLRSQMNLLSAMVLIMPRNTGTFLYREL